MIPKFCFVQTKISLNLLQLFFLQRRRYLLISKNIISHLGLSGLYSDPLQPMLHVFQKGSLYSYSDIVIGYIKVFLLIDNLQQGLSLVKFISQRIVTDKLQS